MSALAYEWKEPSSGKWIPIDREPHPWEIELGLEWRKVSTQDRRESAVTREALAKDGSVIGILRESRRRVRYGSKKAAARMDEAIKLVEEVAETGARMLITGEEVSRLANFGEHNYWMSNEWKQAVAAEGEAVTAFRNALLRFRGVL